MMYVSFYRSIVKHCNWCDDVMGQALDHDEEIVDLALGNIFTYNCCLSLNRHSNTEMTK